MMRLTDLCEQLRTIQAGLDKRPGLRVSGIRYQVTGIAGHVDFVAVSVTGLPLEMYAGDPADALARLMEAIQAKGQDIDDRADAVATEAYCVKREQDELDRINADARAPRKPDYFALACEEAREDGKRLYTEATGRPFPEPETAPGFHWFPASAKVV